MSTSWLQSDPPPALVAQPAVASLDEAHGAIELWEYYSRKKLDSAQRLSVEHMLAENDEGLWAASSTGRAESRQNGKGDEVEVVELWGLTQRGEAILHTAHEAATAASAHHRLVDLLQGHRDLRRKIGRTKKGQEAIQSWNGNYSIKMADGAMIVHRTRTSAIGRGLDDISRLVVDEAQHAKPEELASATPILSVNPNPQKNYIGSAGVAGKSKFWWRLRLEALGVDFGRFAWLEHSAEKISLDDEGNVISVVGDISDRALWRLANPAYPSRISDDFLAGQLRDLGPEHFGREHLCIWDPLDDLGSNRGAFPGGHWADCRRMDYPKPPRPTFAIEVDENGDAASLGASDGTFGQVLEWNRGSKWLVPRLVELGVDHVWLDPKGPAGSLLTALDDAGITWHAIKATEYANACGELYAAVVEDQSFAHADQQVLNIAVEQATRRSYGDAWIWNRRDVDMSVSPLGAVTIARWAALQAVPVAAPVDFFEL